MGTPIKKATMNPNVYTRGDAIPGISIDGTTMSFKLGRSLNGPRVTQFKKNLFSLRLCAIATTAILCLILASLIERETKSKTIERPAILSQ